MVLENKDGFFILNAGEKLFIEIKTKISSGALKEELVSFWKGQVSRHIVSEWSADFEEL